MPGLGPQEQREIAERVIRVRLAKRRKWQQGSYHDLNTAELDAALGREEPKKWHWNRRAGE